MKSRLQTGQVDSLGRQLNVVPNPVTLYASLCENGAVPNTFYFETRRDQEHKAKIATSSSLYVECRQRRVRVEALNENGLNALKHVRRVVSTTQPVENGDENSFFVEYPEPANDLEQSQKLKAPSALDILRVVTQCWREQPSGSPGASIRVQTCGVFSYDLVECYEVLSQNEQDPLDFPDFAFWVPDEWVEVDFLTGQTKVEALVFGAAAGRATYREKQERLRLIVEKCLSRDTVELAPSQRHRASHSNSSAVETDVEDAEFCAKVEELKEKILDGEIFQVVLSRNFSTECREPLLAFHRLRENNPSRYHFYVSHPTWTLFGASPETSVRVEPTERSVELLAIAGTRPRGRDKAGRLLPDLDNRLETELRLSEKEIAEHMMLVDLARNDVARVSKPGTRRVDSLLRVERYQYVMHLVSSVRAQLRDDLDGLHAYRAAMNMGTLTGAPKVRAMSLLRETETVRRGPYGGAVGIYSSSGALDTAIVIRSAWVKNKVAYVRAGAGLVFDSSPQAEADETRHKARAVLHALEEC